MNESASYYRYWGKAKPSDEGSADYHLLPFHCLDVAAVGMEYLKRSTSLLKSCCQLLNCSESAFLSWSAFLLALHDLGKFSEAFQSQRPDLIRVLQKREPNPRKQYTERHDSLGFWLWDNDLLDDDILQKIGIDDSRKSQRGLKCWLLAVTGHHGMPPKSAGTVDFFFCREDKRAATEFIQKLAELLLTEEAKRIPVHAESDFEWNSKTLSWWFAGVAVLADWLGSSRLFFPYCDTSEDLTTYWAYAREQANTALEHSGVLPIAIEQGQTLTDFFSYMLPPTEN